MERTSKADFISLADGQMNLQKITEFYPWDDSSLSGSSHQLAGQFTLCLDRISGSGEFAFVYILLNLVRQGASVKLVSCNHSRMHYASIFRKNNLDMSKLEQTGRFEIIQVEDSCQRNDSGKLSIYNWEELMKWQDNFLTSSTQASTAVFVDDIDILELLAPSPMAARNFITRFLAVLHNTTHISTTDGLNYREGSVSHVVCFGRHPQDTTAQLSSLGSSVVSASNSEDVGENGGLAGPFSAVAPLSTEEDQPALCEYLRYRADVTIVVSALGTGYSSAVHGVIATVQRTQLPRRQTLQYKALDSGVVCGLVGSSF